MLAKSFKHNFMLPPKLFQKFLAIVDRLPVSWVFDSQVKRLQTVNPDHIQVTSISSISTARWDKLWLWVASLLLRGKCE
jgi:hypothetical protein